MDQLRDVMEQYSVGYNVKSKLYVVYFRERKVGSFRSEREAWDFLRRKAEAQVGKASVPAQAV
jgi:hypothetical protein